MNHHLIIVTRNNTCVWNEHGHTLDTVDFGTVLLSVGSIVTGFSSYVEVVYQGSVCTVHLSRTAKLDV